MLKFNKHRVLATLVLLTLVISACGPETTEEAADMSAILTAGVGTLAASIFQTQTALAPPVTQTPSSTSLPTNTALGLPTLASSPTQSFVFGLVATLSSVSPTPTGTRLTPTPNPSLLGFGCNNLILIRDETIPAGTVMRPGESFTKTWKVQNNGTCNWALQFRLVFAGGNNMGGEPSGLGRVIEPAKWTQISTGLIAPNRPGTYTGSWRLGDQSGNAFGSTLTVSIQVANPTNTAPPTLTYTPVTPSNTPIPSETPVPTATQTSP
jgi:hypothetical protein